MKTNNGPVNVYRQVADLEDQILGLRNQQAQLLGNVSSDFPVTFSASRSRTSAAGSPTATGRTMSPEAKARIAAAQKARWAKIRKEKGNTGAPAGSGTRKKRNMSAAARKRISDAQKKRWAERRADKA